MTTNAKISNDKADRIGDLPNSLIYEILSNLDMKQVIQTSILSKRWRHLWISLPSIKFDRSMWLEEGDYSFKFKTNEFTSFVNQVLLLRCQSPYTIHKLSLLHVSNNSVYQIEQWVTCALLLCAQELHLENVEIKFTSILGNAKTLQLTAIDLPFDSPSQELLLSLENVENLVMEDCNHWNRRKVIIDAPSLKYSIVKNKHFWWDMRDCDLTIHAPKLVSIELKGHIYNDYELVNLASLVTARIHIITKHRKKDVLVRCLDKILRGVSYAKSLTLSANALQNFPVLPNWLKHAHYSFHNLKVLELIQWNKDGHIGAMAKLLEKFPCVETLVLDRIETNLERSRMRCNWGVHLSFRCMLNNLKKIEIRNLEGCENEFKFIKFLLENAMDLENITIKETKVLPDDKEKVLIEFSRKLQLLTVASSKVTIVLMLKSETGFTKILGTS